MKDSGRLRGKSSKLREPHGRRPPSLSARTKQGGSGEMSFSRAGVPCEGQAWRRGSRSLPGVG